MRPSFEELKEFTEPKEVLDKFDVSLRTARRWLEYYDLIKIRENYGPNKLNKKQAEKIRKESSNGIDPKILAERYNVTLTNIYRILNNVYYRPKDCSTVSVTYNPH